MMLRSSQCKDNTYRVSAAIDLVVRNDITRFVSDQTSMSSCGSEVRDVDTIAGERCDGTEVVTNN